MPAAKPSQSSITNALSAVVAVGLTPGAIHISGDGSFRIQIGPASEKEFAAANQVRDEDEGEDWEAAAA